MVGGDECSFWYVCLGYCCIFGCFSSLVFLTILVGFSWEGLDCRDVFFLSGFAGYVVDNDFVINVVQRGACGGAG